MLTGPSGLPGVRGRLFAPGHRWARLPRKSGSGEGFSIDDATGQGSQKAIGGFIDTAGAVIAVLLGIPCVFIVVFGAVGVITGQKLVAGGLGAAWGYAAVIGAYELNRRRFHWQRGRRYRDVHLLAGTLAAAIGLAIGGALHESMPALAIIPALSAIKHANDRHDLKYFALVHVAFLIGGIWAGIWLDRSGDYGKYLLDSMAALP